MFDSYRDKYYENKDNALVTVIMQAYNTPIEKLQSAMMHVIHQSFDKLAFIFIDDWSTDDKIFELYEKMLEEWYRVRPNMPMIVVPKPQDSPNDPIEHNHGHSFCRNWGLEAANTEYIYFADSDDEMHPNCIDILYNTISKDNNIDICVGNFVRNEDIWMREKYDFDPHLEDYSYDVKIMQPVEAMANLCLPYMIPAPNGGSKYNPMIVPLCATWNKIFRKSVFKGIRFPDGRTKDDNFTAHHLIHASKKIAFVNKITYYYRHGGQLADSNLYKTKDIIDAHKDRLDMFNSGIMDIYDKVMCNQYNLNAKNFPSYYMALSTIYNERIVFLWTCYQVYKNADDEELVTYAMHQIHAHLYIWKKDLMLYNPIFVRSFLNLWEKESILNE